MQDSLQVATWALVFLTFVLAISTVWYAWSTQGIVRRMDLEKEELSRPRLTFQLIPWQPNLLKLRIENLGAGPAIHIEGKIETMLKIGGQIPVNWSYHLLASNKYEEFGFPMPDDAGSDARFNLDKIRNRVSKVRADFSYISATGRKYQMQDTIDVEAITKDWIASRMMATQDHPDRLLPRIAKALEDLAIRQKSS